MKRLLVRSLLGTYSITTLLGQSPTVRVLKLSDAVPFHMGKVDSRRVLYPDMGAKRITLNYSVSQPGHEFPQHVHDYSDDTFLVLQGQVDVRQGDSRRPLLAGHAAFVPAKQIHGTITTGSGTAILISFQCPPDLALYTGARDSSRPGSAQPQGVITPNAVELLNFAQTRGFFSSPATGSRCVAAAYRRLAPGDSLAADVAEGAEAFFFVWEGHVAVRSAGMETSAGTRDTVFVSGRSRVKLRNDSSAETVLVQVQAPPPARSID